MPNHFHKPYLVSLCLEQCGYSRRHLPGNREDMVNELCHVFAIDVVRGALDQMQEGLGTLVVLGVMKKYPKLMQQAFCARD